MRKKVNKLIFNLIFSHLDVMLCDNHLGPDNSTACKLSVESTIQSELE